MSQSRDGRGMDEPSGVLGSVRRARERAEAGLPREPPAPIPRLPIRNPNNGASRPQAPPGLQSRDGNGNIGLAISRPTPVPQWPLAGPLASPASSEGSEPYRPPGNREPPQRPPRPSRVPSILDGSRIQDHTPVFQYTPQNPRLSELSVPETPATPSSRRTTQSSVGSIPDFPLPIAAPVPLPPRRSVTLGPPPSSRRGNSAFYPTVSYVSPIPEESPRTRSYASYASSAAIPDSFGTISPGSSHDDNYNDGVYFDDTIAEEESVYSADADESRLVRSASIGRKGKPSLVTTKSSNSEKGEMVPIILPVQPPSKPTQEPKSPFQDGTAFLDGSSGSSPAATSNRAPSVGAALTTDNMLNAFDAASSADPSSIKKAASPKPFRLSALRRPPRLNIDAVRDAEARGSLTSLPDLIKRATRLAAMMSEGRRPASRFDDLDFPEDVYGRRNEKGVSGYDLEKHQSGLSDMLAAFPPPAQANSRRSIQQNAAAWPLPFSTKKSPMEMPSEMDRRADTDTESPNPSRGKPGRRCCGLPLWGFLLLMFALILVIAAAIIVPLEFFVIQKRDTTTTTAQPELSDCQNQLTCANGGTNIVTDGVCSCICTNGFTGNDCTTSGSQGCTTTDLTSSDGTLSNVTLGQSIPRLIQEGQTNFSLALSATTILSKFNSANLSCVAENALVTFDGSSSLTTTTSAEVLNVAEVDSDLVKAEAAVSVTVTIMSGVEVTLTLDSGATGGVSVVVSTLTEPLTTSGGSFSTIFATTLSDTASSTPTATTTTVTETAVTVTTTGASATATSTFSVTDQVRDFARVAVLFILQADTVQDAVTAQSSLQKFFTSASSTAGVTNDQARNLTVGGKNTVDLVHLLVNV